MTLRTGTIFQYALVYEQNGQLLVGSGEATEFILNDDKTLVDKKTGKYVTIGNGNFLYEADESIRKFVIQDDYYLVLEIEPNQGFYACYQPDNTYGIKVEKCSAGDPVALKVNGAKEADNYYPHRSTTLTTKTTTPPPKEKPTEPPKEKPAPPSKEEGSFGLIAIHSGSDVQNAAIKKVDSHLHVFSVGGNEGKDVSLTLKEDGSLVDQDGVGIFVDPNTGEFGDINPNSWGNEKPVTGFSIKDGHLLYQGKENWSACPSAPDKYSLANNDCVGGTGIVLKVVQ
jgi:hypothetical protein